MKNIVATALLLFVLNSTIQAQYAISRGGYQLNGGLGLGFYGLPVYLSLDHGKTKNISIGFEVNRRNISENFDGENFVTSVTGLLLNANFHFGGIIGIKQNVDIYIGPNLGYYIFTTPAGYLGNRSSGLGIAGQLGARYYVTKRIGVNVELSLGNEFVSDKVGISLKL